MSKSKKSNGEVVGYATSHRLKRIREQVMSKMPNADAVATVAVEGGRLLICWDGVGGPVEGARFFLAAAQQAMAAAQEREAAMAAQAASRQPQGLVSGAGVNQEKLAALMDAANPKNGGH